jgi:hypothetical protein
MEYLPTDSKMLINEVGGGSINRGLRRKQIKGFEEV